MSIDDTSGGRYDPAPFGGEPDGAVGVPGDLFAGDEWDAGLGETWADPAAENLFSAELANVDASDWDIDADAIWGEDPASVDHVDDGGGAFDMPL